MLDKLRGRLGLRWQDRPRDVPRPPLPQQPREVFPAIEELRQIRRWRSPAGLHALDTAESELKEASNLCWATANDRRDGRLPGRLVEVVAPIDKVVEGAYEVIVKVNKAFHTEKERETLAQGVTAIADRTQRLQHAALQCDELARGEREHEASQGERFVANPYMRRYHQVGLRVGCAYGVLSDEQERDLADDPRFHYNQEVVPVGEPNYDLINSTRPRQPAKWRRRIQRFRTAARRGVRR